MSLLLSKAGFNGGFGRGWSSAIALQRVRNITQYQASDRLGRYIYQINEERIITGGCNNPDGNANQFFIWVCYKS